MTMQLGRFAAPDLLRCRAGLARQVRGASSLADAAQAACRHFYDDLLAPDGASRACALVRCFKTHPYGLLEPALQQDARALLDAGRTCSTEMPCLALVASVGDEPLWCSRHASRRRRCLPLECSQAVARAPMWSQFFKETGVHTQRLARVRSPEIVDPVARAVNVFCVECAEGAASIPDQDQFVRRYGIRSVFGFCGRLRHGDLFVLVLFSRMTVTRESAALLRPLGLDLAGTFLRFEDDRVFDQAAVTIMDGRG